MRRWVKEAHLFELVFALLSGNVAEHLLDGADHASFFNFKVALLAYYY